MIRNLDYWQPATTNIVIVNSNNNNRSVPPSNATATATTAIGDEVNVNNNDNNNEDGFGDKNGAGGRKITPGVGGRHSTVIVKMAHENDEQIEVMHEEVLLVEEADEDDLIDEEPEEDDMVIEEPEETVTDTKAPEGEEDHVEVIVEEEEEHIVEPVTPKSSGKGKNKSTPKNRSTPTSSSNNSSFEEQQQTMTNSSITSTPSPDHHARRPMNAFLIFCKKHRPIVRERYPNLENRAITKILGDWWANLEKKDQDPFKSLASDYKDAFLSANPTFKWYKLPAPPLRTLSTRPTNSDRSYGDLLTNGLNPGQKHSPAAALLLPNKPHPHNTAEYEDEYVQPVVHRRRGTKNNMQLFKLADENQMGGLSNLMGVTAIRVNDNNNNHNFTAAREDLHASSSATALSEEPFANMRTHAARMEVTPKRKLTDVHSEFQAMKRAKKRADEMESAGQELLVSPVSSSSTGQKSSRACKGKKYLEFIKQNKAVQQVTAQGQQNQQHPAQQSAMVALMKENGSGPMDGNGNLRAAETVIRKASQQPTIIKQVGFPHNGYCKPQPLVEEEVSVAMEKINTRTEEGGESMCDRQKRGIVIGMQQQVDDIGEREGGPMEGNGAVDVEKLDQNNGKLFDASDFELDSKIGALPALNLDMYLTRKRETKKKKKIGGKGKGHHAKKQAIGSGLTIHEAKEALQKVGSQKRKARKESITRRDVHSVGGEGVGLNSGQGGVQEEEEGSASDLLILATLAAGEIDTHQK